VNQSDCNFPIATSCSWKEEGLNEVERGSIYVFGTCVPSVNLQMNSTQQKAVCKQQPDKMAINGVRLVWGRGRNCDARSVWNTVCYSIVWDTVDQITWVWAFKYCSDCTSYCRSPLLSFVLILLPNARSISHRCPHLKNKLLYLYWGMQGAGRMLRPLQMIQTTHMYTGTCQTEMVVEYIGRYSLCTRF
jgi:hypothetical protein